MILVPVEVLGSTLGGADKVKVELDYGTDMVPLNGSFEGSNYGIPYGSLLGNSLLDPSYDSFGVSNDGPPDGALPGD